MWKFTKGYASACKSSWETMFQFCLGMEFKLEEKNESTGHFQKKDEITGKPTFILLLMWV